MNIYQEEILDHFKRPRHKGSLTDATASAHLTNPTCGDQITVSVKVAGDSLEHFVFDGQGCAISQAAASMLTEELTGKSLEEVKAFSDEDMLELIGVELTPARQKCGLLARSALRKALRDVE